MHRWVAAVAAVGILAGCGAWTEPSRPAPLPAAHAPLHDPRATFVQAYQLYQQGELRSALALFSALNEHYPALGDYHLYYIGVLSGRLGDEATARAAFAKLPAVYPDSIKAAPGELELGRLLLRGGDPEGARVPLERAARAPDVATARSATLALAQADEMRGEITAAYDTYMTLRRDAPGSVWGGAAKSGVLALRSAHPELEPAGTARVDELRLLVGERDWRAADVLARTLLAEPDGGSIDVLQLYADTLSGEGQIDAVVGVLQQVADRYPRDPAAPAALLRAASILWNRDRDREALPGFESVVAAYPDAAEAAEALYAIGRIEQAAGRQAEALRAYDGVLRRYPSSKVAAEARWRIGWAYYEAREWRQAAAAFAALARVTTGAQEDGALYWQARALEHAGDRAAARGLYDQIIERLPEGYYAMWAQQRVAAGVDGMHAPLGHSAATEIIAPAEPVEPEVFPGINSFHSGRAEELRLAGLLTMARAELAAVEEQYGGDPQVTGYLLRAYPAVDGYAAAIRLAQRAGAGAELSSAQRAHLLYPLAFWDLVRRAAAANDLDPLLVQAIMRQESLFDPTARSPANAIGLMQLLPRTAENVAASGEPAVDPTALTDPDTNVQLGTRYLRTVLDRVGGDPLKAIAAYNGGEAAVGKWEARYGTLSADEFVESISYRETRDYVKKVVANYRMYRHLYVVGGA